MPLLFKSPTQPTDFFKLTRFVWYSYGILITENPVAEEDDYRVEVLIALRKLERLDKEEYNEDERNDAEEIAEQRRQEEANAEVGVQLSLHMVLH